jgi:hypothetical protein
MNILKKSFFDFFEIVVRIPNISAILVAENMKIICRFSKLVAREKKKI